MASSSPIPDTPSSRALTAWLVAASGTIFVVAGAILFLILLADRGAPQALAIALPGAAAVAAIAGLALRRDARRKLPA